jgi:hypothetical protein
VSAPGSLAYGDTSGSAVASGGSGTGAYSYSAGSSTACSVNPSTGAITVTSGTGTCSITATKAGDINYNVSAVSAAANVTINKANQTITFDPLPGKVIGDGDFAPGAITSSELALSYMSSNTSVATIVSGNIHIVGTGTSIITASQPGDSNFNAAASVPQTLTVVTPEMMPDLVISFLSLAVGPPTYPGGSLSITASTWNRGGGNAGHSFTKFYLAPGSCTGTPQVELTGNRYIASLPAGITDSPGAISVTVPEGTTPGTYYLIATADATDIVRELSSGTDAETNNSRCAAGTPITVAPGGADLVISIASGPSAGVRGSKITLADTTWNRGTGGAVASTTKVYLRCAGMTPDALIDTRAIGSLAAGATSASGSHLSTNVIPLTAPAGVCSLIFVADDGNAVIESTETNNTKTLSIGIR